MISGRESKKSKTIRVKKIKHTNPGESTRSCKNKPLIERIGGRNKKGTTKVYENGCVTKRNTRKGKNGLDNIAINVNKDPLVNFSTYPRENFIDFDMYSTKHNSSFIKKMNRRIPNHEKNEITETYYSCILSPSGRNLINEKEIWENGCIIEKTSEKILL